MRTSNFIVILFFFLTKITGIIHAQEKPLPLLHSHNDYEQDRPLINAIDSQFDSVEADIWWSHGEVKVSHLDFFFTGTLEELYLRPLFERVKSLGSVYGNSWAETGTIKKLCDKTKKTMA